MKDDLRDTPRDIAETLGLGVKTGPVGRLRRWLGWGVGLLLLAAAAGAYWLQRSGGDGVQYQTQEARRADLTVTVTATGNLAPTNEVEVGSELSGIVRTVAVDYNGRVTVGQPLAHLDDTKFAAAVMKSRAALASAQAQLQRALATLGKEEQNLKRIQEARRISGGRLLSESDLESAEAELERARAEVAIARAAIQQAEATLLADETDLAKTVIYSPVDGIVLARSVEPGQTVAASLQAPVLFTLAEDLAQMELQVEVDEADVGLVREGQTATFTVDAYPERTFEALITQVRYGSQTTDEVVTYKAVLKVDNPDLALRPGMTATADITVQKIEDALLVPNAALRFSPAQPRQKGPSRGLFEVLIPRPPRSGARPQSDLKGEGEGRRLRVWVLQDGQPVPKAVTVGATDGAFTEVTGGDLAPGTALVIGSIGGVK
jgi:HlyD family secretion protein